MTLRTDAIRELSAWAAPTPDQVLLRASYLDYLAEHEDAMWRSCRPAHLTASALVLDPSGPQVLLTLHPKVGRWLQLGGHCEPADVTLAGAALRESVEESGLSSLRMTDAPARLDQHPVRCGDDGTSAVHLDVQYVALGSRDEATTRSDESDDLRWWPTDGLPADVDVSVRTLVAHALAAAY